jgi:hypothetical protein
MSTTTHTWDEHRERFVEATGDAPSSDLEARILDVFERHPTLVIAGVDHVAGRYERGLVRAPWVVLAMHVEEAAASSARASVPVQDERDRDRARSRAAQWMRVVGLLFESESELRDELFGERGMLRDFANDSELAEALIDLWHDLRPIGQRIEREAVERGRLNVAARAATRSRPSEIVEGTATIASQTPVMPRSSSVPSDAEIDALLLTGTAIA